MLITVSKKYLIKNNNETLKVSLNKANITNKKPKKEKMLNAILKSVREYKNHLF